MAGLHGHLPDGKRITRLEQAVEHLEKRVELLCERLVHSDAVNGQEWSIFPKHWGLSSLESRVLRALSDRDRLLAAEIAEIVYAGTPVEDRPSVKVIHVIMHRLRTKLGRHGVAVMTVRTGPNRGYVISAPDREIVRAAIVEVPQ